MRKAMHRATYIKPETICIGDTIKVVYSPDELNDTTRSVIGTVAARNQKPPFTTEYLSIKGYPLLVTVQGGKNPKIVLLHREELKDALTLDGIK